MLELEAAKEIKHTSNSFESWKHQDKYVENYMAENYDRIYNRTFFRHNMYNDFANEVKKRLHKNSKVLEIGCGTATIIKRLKSKNIPDNVDFYCVDYSNNMIKIAKTRSEYFVQSDMESLPFQDGSFDVIFVHSALHHFPSLLNIMKEIKRILNSKEGVLIVQEPCEFELENILLLRGLSFVACKTGTQTYKDLSHLELSPSDHHTPLPTDKLISEIEESGFTISKKKNKYYASRKFAGLDSLMLSIIGRILDKYYVRKYKCGYLFFIEAKLT
ncbi:MAG: class I SAM-dependent methyltransferase [Nitrososphaeraceae archaeon]